MTPEMAWYKQGWPWFVISIPFSAVVFGILMLVVVEEHPDDLVVDDYYKDGMAINEQLDRDRNAERLGIVARLISVDKQGVRFHFSNTTDPGIAFNVYHVVDHKRDKRLVLYPEDQSGAYMTSDPSLVDVFGTRGIWYLEFEGSDWRLRARVKTPLDKLEIDDR